MCVCESSACVSWNLYSVFEIVTDDERYGEPEINVSFLVFISFAHRSRGSGRINQKAPYLPGTY